MKRWFLGDEAGPRYQEARLAVIERLLRLAVERSCTAVVVAGDVFDDNLVDDRTWRRAVDILKSSPVPVLLLPGNHDPFDPASIYRDPVFDDLAPTVTVLSDGRTHRIGEQADSSAPTSAPTRPYLDVIGAPLLSKYMSDDPVAGALRVLRRQDEEDGPVQRTDRVRVLVGHGATQSRSSDEQPGVIDVNNAVQACRDRVVDYIALGDTHSAMSLHSDGTVRYSGSPEPTDFREEGGGGESRSGYALIVDITAGEEPSVAVEEVPVGVWHFLALAAHIDSIDDLSEWVRRLDELPDKRTTVVKYALTGTVDLGLGARLDREMDRLRPSFAALYPRERLMNLRTIAGDDELADAHWPGAVGAAAQALAARSAQGEDAARDALRLLYRLSTDPTNERRN